MDVETLGDTLSDAHALIKALADTEAEIALYSELDRFSDAQELVDKIAEVEAETLGHTRRCAGTGRAAG